MSFNWGFNLKNRKDKKFSLSLISFCGWNTKELYTNIQHRCVANLDDEKQEHEINLDGFLKYLIPIDKMRDFIGNTSSRQLDEWEISKKQQKLYEDICYELDIPLDTIIVFSLIRLYYFKNFLEAGDMFEEWFEFEKDNYLELWGSW